MSISRSSIERANEAQNIKPVKVKSHTPEKSDIKTRRSKSKGNLLGVESVSMDDVRDETADKDTISDEQLKKTSNLEIRSDEKSNNQTKKILPDYLL